MRNSKNLIIILVFVGLAACCGKPKSTDAAVSDQEAQTAQAVSVQQNPVVAEETSKKSPAASPFVSGSEFIFSGDAPVTEQKLKAAFGQIGLTQVRSLGGNQFFLKFSENHNEEELKSILDKNKLTGTLSKNLQYKIPKPGDKNQQNNKLKM